MPHLRQNTERPGAISSAPLNQQCKGMELLVKVSKNDAAHVATGKFRTSGAKNSSLASHEIANHRIVRGSSRPGSLTVA